MAKPKYYEIKTHVPDENGRALCGQQNFLDLATEGEQATCKNCLSRLAMIQQGDTGRIDYVKWKKTSTRTQALSRVAYGQNAGWG